MLRTRGAGAQLVSVDAFAFPTDPGTGKPVIPPAAPFIGTYTGGRHALIQVPPTPYPAEVVSEFRALPVQPNIMEKWLGGNATALLGRSLQRA